MKATFNKGIAIALLAAAMSLPGSVSAYPTTPCNSSNEWEEQSFPIPPYDGWDTVVYTCVPNYGWYLSAQCNSWTGVCFYY